jgi:hypothetical protein
MQSKFGGPLNWKILHEKVMMTLFLLLCMKSVISQYTPINPEINGRKTILIQKGKSWGTLRK